MPYIHARDLVVEFPIFENSNRSFKNVLMNATTGGRLARDARLRPSVRAIDRVSFDIKAGDRVGLIGHNGSGKTTLLRVFAGAYEPASGYIRMQGRIVSLLDVSLGMDPDATGYENIFLRGIVLGMRPNQIREKVAEIADFTELGEFLDLPVRTYSSGMQLRLAFAVSTSVDADILIMDEWLSVGDKNFNEKATERLQSLVDRTPILVVATHSQDLLRNACNRAFELEHGRIVREFDPRKVSAI